MAKLNLKLKTSSCDTCGYVQDFEPTPEAMQWHMVDSVPKKDRGEAWARLANHDWSIPVCPACIGRDGKVYELLQKEKVSKGLKSAPEAFNVKLAGTPELTPELNNPIIVTALTDDEITGLIKVSDPNDEIPEVQIRSLEEADEEDRVAALQGLQVLDRTELSTEEREEYRTKTKVSLQELVDRGMLDETDLPTKKIRMNLAKGKLADR